MASPVVVDDIDFSITKKPEPIVVKPADSLTVAERLDGKADEGHERPTGRPRTLDQRMSTHWSERR